MYEQFYGLIGNPFSIHPDPRCFYMSTGHTEALMHLSYGLDNDHGFILFTGEVGTGKTTLLNTLIGSKKHEYTIITPANPFISKNDLILELAQHFNIKLSDDNTLNHVRNTLIETIKAHYKQQKKKILILFDESQHLDFDILEELRLLTDYKQEQKTLIQIILIGQPELQEKLHQHHFRQLSQRIITQYHLKQLNFKDMLTYIQFRLKKFGVNRRLFTRRALKMLYQYSKGTPRIINLIADKALLSGFMRKSKKVDYIDIQLALEDLNLYQKKSYSKKRIILSFLISSCIVFIYPFMGSHDILSHITDYQFTTSIQKNDAEMEYFNHFLIENEPNELQAFQSIFYHLNFKKIPENIPCRYAKQHKLQCLTVQSNFNLLKKISQPSVIQLAINDNYSVYAALLSIHEKESIIQLIDEQFTVSNIWLQQHMLKNLTIIAPEHAYIPKEINITSNKNDIQWLENQLATIEKRKPRSVNRFDNTLQDNLTQILSQYQITTEAQNVNHNMLNIIYHLSNQEQ